MRNFRLFLFGHLVSSTGTWMQQVGQDWLVLRLTNAPLPLGITLALQFSPMLVFGAWAGLVADRVDKRRLLLATQASMAVLALALGVLTATGAVRLWMVYALALPLGITLALQFSPMLVFGAWAGLVADRVDKRRLLLATQASMAVLALALGVLTATGAVRLWMVYALALLLGVCTAFDMPARQSFVSEMVGPDRVANAVGLNSASFNTARVVGPAVAGGLIAAVGIAPAFLLNAVSFLAMIGGLVAMDPDRLYRRVAVERGRGQIRAGLRYVWATPVLRSTILLVAVVGMLGLNYRVALPLLARFAFSGGPGAYGALAAVMAAGSVAGALAVARRGRPTRLLLIGSVAAFGLLSFAAAAAPSMLVEALFLFPIGAASLAFVATANSTIQLASEPGMRGRVMSLYGLVLLGSTPPSGLLSGWLAGQFGPRSILLLSGASCVAAAGVAAVAGRGRVAQSPAAPGDAEQAA